MTESSEHKIGISLKDIKTSKVESLPSSQHNASDISAYAGDVKRCVLVGLLAIALELGIYFSGLLH